MEIDKRFGWKVKLSRFLLIGEGGLICAPPEWHLICIAHCHHITMLFQTYIVTRSISVPHEQTPLLIASAVGVPKLAVSRSWGVGAYPETEPITDRRAIWWSMQPCTGILISKVPHRRLLVTAFQANLYFFWKLVCEQQLEHTCMFVGGNLIPYI